MPLVGPSSLRSRTAFAAALFVLGLLTRWPLRARVLEEYDSANYALAVLRFDLMEDRPHPPGYIFHVWASRLAYALTGDPIDALTAVSAVSGALAIALLFLLLVPAMGTWPALAACVASLFTAQVWLQHVRPMQDVFGFLWMVAAALALASATRRRSLGAWCASMGLVGASMGAKHALPVFLAGMILWAGREAWRYGRLRWLAAGAAAMLAGTVTWLVPLSLLTGSPAAYADAILEKAGWHAENEAALFAGQGSRLGEKLHVALVAAAGPPLLALPLWALCLAGSVRVARRHESAWLVWLLALLLPIRVLLVGVWPRFGQYYLPFVIALAVIGLHGLLRPLPTAVRSLALTGSLALWGLLQARHVLPTMYALRDGRSPVETAVRAVAARYPPDALLLSEPGALSRHATYYAERQHVQHMLEPELTTPLAQAPHILKLHTASHASISSSWAGRGEPVGSWHLEVPRADELTPLREFWHVGLFEIRGVYVSLRRWDVDEQGRRHAGRSSAILVLRAPRRGLVVRVSARASGPVRFTVDQRRAVVWNGQGTAFELPIEPSESADGRVRIEVAPACATLSACFELLGVEARVAGE